MTLVLSTAALNDSIVTERPNLIQIRIGAMMLGALIASAYVFVPITLRASYECIDRLWGVACTQAWHYYQHFPNDTTFLKWYVFAAIAADTAHQVLVVHGRKYYNLCSPYMFEMTVYLVWYYAVANWAHPSALLSNVWSYIFQLIPAGIEIFLVQSFFIYRIYIRELISEDWLLIASADLTILSERREMVDHRASPWDKHDHRGAYSLLRLAKRPNRGF
jgi:hypothetical protein